MEEGTNLPISKAVVHLINAKDERAVATLKTNRLGEFYYPNKSGENYRITVIKNGFSQSPSFDYKNEKAKMPELFVLKKIEREHYSLIEIIVVYTEDLLGLGMESLLLLGFLVQIYFIFTFGFLRIAPFMLITIFNLILIFTFLYKPKGLNP